MNPFDNQMIPGISNTIMPLILMFIVLISIGGSMVENPSFTFQQLQPLNPLPPVVLNNNDYKNFQVQDNGIVRLNKGKRKVIHHDIKIDSIIILSRKSLEGKAGVNLIVDIVPNESFTISSVNGEAEIELDDCGEVYYKIF
jgi:hypothetical protein